MGDIVTLYRDIAIERLTQIGQNSGFSSTAFNAEFNNLYLIAQQLESSIAQCLQIPNTNNPAPITTLTKATYAGKYLSFDSNGNPQPALLTSSGSLTGAIIASLLTSTLLAPFFHWGQTAAEALAGVVPTDEGYAPPNWPGFKLERYGGDSTGVSDNSAAFTKLIDVMLAAGGMSVVLPPGVYNLNTAQVFTLYPSSGANTKSNGFRISGYGAVINFTGTGFAFDLSAGPGTSPFFYQPDVAFEGINFLGTAAGGGALRTTDLNNGRHKDLFALNFTTGTGFALRNVNNWSEVNEFRGCGAVNCYNAWTFVAPGGAQNSFARTLIDHPFCAGILADWFDVGGGCALYDSTITNVSGNFGSLSMMAIGTNAGNSADLTGTTIEGIKYEVNSAPAITFTAGASIGATSATLLAPFALASGTYKAVFSDAETRVVTLTKGLTTCTWSSGLSGNVTAATVLAQSVFRLRDYPQNTGTARRPIVTNINTYATSNGALPVWADGTNTAQVLEPAQTQTFVAHTGMQAYEPLYGVNAVTTVATKDVTQPTLTLTGFTTTVSGRVRFYRNGDLAEMLVVDALTGTSNATSMTMQLPAEYFPAVAIGALPCLVEDNGNIVPGAVSISTGGLMTFSKFNGTTYTTFTSTGTKGLGATWVIPPWPLT